MAKRSRGRAETERRESESYALDSGHIRSIFEFFPPGSKFDQNLIAAARGFFDRFSVATAVVFHFFLDRSTLSEQRAEFYFLNEKRHAGTVRQFFEEPLIRRMVRNGARDSCFVAGMLEGNLACAFVCQRPEHDHPESASASTYILLMVVDKSAAGLVEKYLSDPVSTGLVENPAPELYGTLYMILTAVGYRERLLSFFAPKFRIAFWNRASGIGRGIPSPWGVSTRELGPGRTQHDRARLGLRTLSLSLDLRRSTFAMREAKDQLLYAYWMEALVEIMRAIAHDNLGVFDKFTGDGVLIHFLADDIADINEIWPRADLESATFEENGEDTSLRLESRERLLKATVLSIRCAREMTVAIDHHLKGTLPNLRIVSRDFGGAVGLAEDDAVWTMDNDGRPVVVGRGVVNACRLSDGGAGSIHVTNDIRWLLSDWRSDFGFGDMDLKTKDYPESLHAVAWRLQELPSVLTRRPADIHQLVDRIWHQTLRRAR